MQTPQCCAIRARFFLELKEIVFKRRALKRKSNLNLFVVDKKGNLQAKREKVGLVNGFRKITKRC